MAAVANPTAIHRILDEILGDAAPTAMAPSVLPAQCFTRLSVPRYPFRGDDPNMARPCWQDQRLHAEARYRHVQAVLRLSRLTLTDFRNYTALTWRPATRISVLYGPNGSGKTNLLEALSLLVPGRGLRGARHADLARQGGAGGWAVNARFHTRNGETSPGSGEASPGNGEINIGTGTDADTDRRVFRLDGSTTRSQADIARVVAAVWLTPQMDRLFQDGLTGRRRFLDRLVWALEPGHAREIAAHDTAVHSRNRLLAQRRPGNAPAGGSGTDPTAAARSPQHGSWLAGLEDAIARHAVAASAARLDLVTRLNAQIEVSLAQAFPPSRISLACPIVERLTSLPALAVEDWLRAGLEADRARDAAAGITALGAHRCDMRLTDVSTGTPAALASTGQHKALLIGIVLAHAGLIASARGFAPLLLLDEPSVHLDAGRRAALWNVLVTLPAQVIVTGTDADTFLPLAAHAEALLTGAGDLLADSRFIRSETDRTPVPAPR
ncbi:DNA replication/repair protein RecF [Rhodopila sp.]|uniref:DNA replication/repair protein RecF n=1 Tax=Rhodopila sp. TaxID=2480087 RepID=UPI003D0CC9C3